MTKKTVEELLFKDGELNAPVVRGVINKWVDDREESDYTDEKGNNAVNYSAGLKRGLYNHWESWVDRKVEGRVVEVCKENDCYDEIQNVFHTHLDNNEELFDRIKAISYWCKEGHILINVSKSEELGGIDYLLEKYGKHELAKAVTENRVDELRHKTTGSSDVEVEHKDQSSLGQSEFPQLYDLGVVDDSGNFVTSKLRGLAVAFSDDIDEIEGPHKYFKPEYAQRAFLEWGYEKFGDEWMALGAKYVDTSDIYTAIAHVYSSMDDVSHNFHTKYEHNTELDKGKFATDDVIREFLKDEVDGYGEEDDDDKETRSTDKWEQFEKEAEQTVDEGGDGKSSPDDSDGVVVPDDSGGNGDSGESDSGVGDKWDQFEQRSKDEVDEPANTKQTVDKSDSGSSNGSSDTGSSSRTSGASTLGEWGDENKKSTRNGNSDKGSVSTTSEAGDGPVSSDGDSDSDSSGGFEDVPTSTNGDSTDISLDGIVDRIAHDVQKLKGGLRDLSGSQERQPFYKVGNQPDVERLDELERNKIYEGNVYKWASKLPENSVDVIATSPPYYDLRDYDIEDAVPVGGNHECDHEWEDQECVKCGAWLGQLGAEPEPAMFIDHIVDLMTRLRKVLKPTGSLWLNIGDTYAGKDFDGRLNARRKSRMYIPERIYTALIEEGWCLRSNVIWAKKVWMPDDDLRGNGKPFAGSSRVANQWEPMPRFTPEPDHYSDVDSNRLMPPSFDGDLGQAAQDSKFRDGEDTRRGKTYNSMGTNPPDVWLINGDGYDGDHRAVFPEQLPARCINLSCPDKVCSECGKPYEKEVKIKDETVLNPGGDYADYQQSCGCDADYEPGVAMDPFLGSGTTAVAAANNGFDWIGVELSSKYADLARKRIPQGRQIKLGEQ